MTRIGTPLSPTATRVLLCGCGELGKEVVIELQRLGAEVIAVDRYANAPAMQVAHRSHVINMLDGAALRAVIEAEKPHFIVPEIEAIATATLVELESEGFTVVPTARAAQLTMNREGIRRLAAEELKLPTSPYHFADTFEDYSKAVEDLGFPCVVKPVMSSSGKGQSLLRSVDDVQKAWDYAQEGGRAGKGRVIVEGFIDFDYEITLLTVRHIGGTTFCAPVGHRQEKGDYQESWQPQAMSPLALAESERVAKAVTEALGGRGMFGVELFIKGDQVWFSEVSPRPHDTGMVTMISQDLSQFALHARAILGLPIPLIRQFGPSASAVILVEGQSTQTAFANLGAALSEPDTALRLFGKPEVNGQRRMGVALARDESIEAARGGRRRAVKPRRLIRVAPTSPLPKSPSTIRSLWEPACWLTAKGGHPPRLSADLVQIAVARLLQAQYGNQAQQRRRRHIPADPAQAAHRHQLLGKERRRRGSDDAAQVIRRRGAGITHVGGKQLRQQCAHRCKGNPHQKQLKAQEQCHAPGRTMAQQWLHGEPGKQRQHGTDDQHRLAPEAVAGPRCQRCCGGHEEDGETQQAEKGLTAVTQVGDAVAQGKHRRDVEQRVTHHHGHRAQQHRHPVAAEQLDQWHLHPFVTGYRVGEDGGFLQL